ncbi:DHS-like NAD/FAD-binding domain-containing protein [Clavulina sp. PMI_390]|nr:DHS-like NAD/FAD-binding domain-containing protein [Clavulina sp. PMI_390]
MRISIPTITLDPLARSVPVLPLEAAIERVAEFLSAGSVSVLTGAGVSVDSGIRAYRGKNGRYLNPNYHPIFYQELVDPSPKGYSFRQRYWARSYLGWPAVRFVHPNPTHYTLSALQYSNVVGSIITQNVDGLHHRATSSIWGSIEREKRILELHGRLRTVSCSHGHTVPRPEFQDRISALNPHWKSYADELMETGSEPRTNPDGDVELQGRSFDDFIVPECETCQKQGLNLIKKSIMKPDVIFFGESIAPKVKEESFRMVDESNRLLVIGTTLATYSAFRIVRHALDTQKDVLLLNVGPTRADALGVEKIEWESGKVLKEATTLALRNRLDRDAELRKLLNSGAVAPPLID